MTTVADLLKVDVEKLKHALTVRQMSVRGQAIVVPLKPPEANDSRDALAKALYGKLFSWLVKSINQSLSAPPDRVRSFIGILDIYPLFLFIFYYVRFFSCCLSSLRSLISSYFRI